jgi:kynurenine formamidase
MHGALPSAVRYRPLLAGQHLLLVRTGWLGYFLDAPPDARQAVMGPVPAVPGLEPTEAMAAFLWDLHVAAVASDTMAVEASRPALDFPLHRRLLPLLGIPLGELWVLDELADACAADGRYDAFVVSVPLYLRGAVGSPAQAVAIR